MNKYSQIPVPSAQARDAARAHQAQLTKPTGSLGRLEAIAVELAGWFDDVRPSPRPAAAIIFAADHAVSRLGVSAYPREVTRAMVRNFLSGGAAACVLSRYHQVPLTVIDVGVDGGNLLWTGPGYVRDPVAEAPCGDLVTTDAMDTATLESALLAGCNAVRMLPNDVRVVVLGEMGIGNTTVASALTCSLLGGNPADWVGRGTGVDDHVLALKHDVVARAVARVGRNLSPLDCLRRLGGRDIAALVGAMLEAARRRRLVLVDGFIVTAAALVATQIEPRVRSALMFSHRSAEAAHHRMLLALAAEPLLDLDLRLGEGSGALVALSLLDVACRLHNEMATFSGAGVPDRAP